MLHKDVRGCEQGEWGAGGDRTKTYNELGEHKKQNPLDTRAEHGSSSSWASCWWGRSSSRWGAGEEEEAAAPKLVKLPKLHFNFSFSFSQFGTNAADIQLIETEREKHAKQDVDRTLLLACQQRAACVHVCVCECALLQGIHLPLQKRQLPLCCVPWCATAKDYSY